MNEEFTKVLTNWVEPTYNSQWKYTKSIVEEHNSGVFTFSFDNEDNGLGAKEIIVKMRFTGNYDEDFLFSLLGKYTWEFGSAPLEKESGLIYFPPIKRHKSWHGNYIEIIFHLEYMKGLGWNLLYHTYGPKGNNGITRFVRLVDSNYNNMAAFCGRQIAKGFQVSVGTKYSDDYGGTWLVPHSAEAGNGAQIEIWYKTTPIITDLKQNGYVEV